MTKILKFLLICQVEKISFALMLAYFISNVIVVAEKCDACETRLNKFCCMRPKGCDKRIVCDFADKPKDNIILEETATTLTIDTEETMATSEDCIDNDGNACDGCLGHVGYCNTRTYEQCKDKEVNGAKWCGATQGLAVLPIVVVTAKTQHGSYPPSNLIDSNPNTFYASYGTTAVQPWVQLKLQPGSVVNEVKITNRVNCCGERLSDVEVRVGDEAVTKQNLHGLYSNKLCGKYDGPGKNGEVVRIECPEPIPGRYITIQIKDRSNQPMNIGEVEAFGTISEDNYIERKGNCKWPVGSAGTLIARNLRDAKQVCDSEPTCKLFEKISYDRFLSCPNGSRIYFADDILYIKKVIWKGPTEEVWTSAQCKLLNWMQLTTLQGCKTLCHENELECNAIEWGQTRTIERGGICEFWKCPEPVPKPTRKRRKFIGYYYGKD